MKTVLFVLVASRAVASRAVVFVITLLLAGSPALADATEPAATSAAPELMPLDACVAEALERSPLMAAAQENVAVFEAKLSEARWGWFPRGELKAELGLMPAKRGDALSGVTDFSEWGAWWRVRIEAAIPVYTFGKISSLKAAAQAGVDVADAVVDLARAELRFRVYQAFETWQLGRQMEAIVADGRKYVDRARKRMERLDEEDDEDFDPVDLLRLRVYEADVQQLLVQARRTQVLALHGMALLLGREGEGGVVSRDTSIRLEERDLEPVEVVLGDLDDRLRDARGEQPALRAARHGLRARKAQAEAKWAELYPDLFVGGYVSYAQSTVADPQDSPFARDPWNSWYGGAAVGLRYDINVPRRLAQSRGADAQAALMEQIGRVLAAQTALEVESAFREAKDLGEMLHTYDRARRAARAWVMAKSDLYDAGFAPVKDVTDALVEYFKRKLGYVKAVYDFNISVARLSRAMGSDLVLASQEGAAVQGAASERGATEPVAGGTR